MVDFNNEATIATPAVDIERVLILQKRENYLEAWESFLTKKAKNQLTGSELPILRARLHNLYYQLYAMLLRVSSEKVEEYERLMASFDPEDIHTVFKEISIDLDLIGLTKVDVKRKLGGNLRERNEAKGWKS